MEASQLRKPVLTARTYASSMNYFLPCTEAADAWAFFAQELQAASATLVGSAQHHTWASDVADADDSSSASSFMPWGPGAQEVQMDADDSSTTSSAALLEVDGSSIAAKLKEAVDDSATSERGMDCDCSAGGLALVGAEASAEASAEAPAEASGAEASSGGILKGLMLLAFWIGLLPPSLQTSVPSCITYPISKSDHFPCHRYLSRNLSCLLDGVPGQLDAFTSCKASLDVTARMTCSPPSTPCSMWSRLDTSSQAPSPYDNQTSISAVSDCLKQDCN
jgi:hypothetical protein